MRFSTHCITSWKSPRYIIFSDYLWTYLSKLHSLSRNNSVHLKPEGNIFTIVCRRSQNYSRIYLEGNLKKYQYLLFSNIIVQFEIKMSSNYLLRFSKGLCLNYCFTDWLVNNLLLKNALSPTTYWLRVRITLAMIKILFFFNVATIYNPVRILC